MSSVNQPIDAYPATHDDFFTRSMSDLRVAKEVLQQHLPKDILQAIHLKAIEICKDKFHDINLSSQFTDMLYSVPLRDSPQPAYIAALVEHQSVPQEHMPLRVLRYEVAIMQRHWDRYESLPLVYTLVFYNGKPPWNYPRDIKALIQAPEDLVTRYALQPFQLIELNRIADEELRQSLWAGVMSLAMKHIFDRDILPALRGYIDLLKVLKRQRGGDDYVVSLLYYLYQRGDISDESQFKALIATELPSNLGERTMTLAELHTQRGIQQGMQQIARNLLREGLDPAFVQKTTGVEMTAIQEIIAELKTEKV